MNTKGNITVIGIGKLGLCFSLVLEKNGYNVLGVDIDISYVRGINNKTLLSTEPLVEEYLINSKNFVATTDIKRGIDFSNKLFIFVATPSLDDGRYDHQQINKVVKQIIKSNNANHSKHIIIGCTTMPGYCDTIIKQFESTNYSISYSPEFIAQGSIITDLSNPDLLLIGEGNQFAGDEIESVYGSILMNKPQVYRMSCKEAEITKIALNCFLTTKIAYANMVGDIALSAGCDPDLILEAIGSDSRIGKKNIKYGYGYGGPCFPRDNRAFASFAADLNIDAVISKASEVANQQHLQFQVNNYIETHDISESITFSDIAYKSGTMIIEESQKLALALALAGRGYNIIIKDDAQIIRKVKLLYGDIFQYKEL